jgi:lysophospholipase L1-like esterase
MRRALAKGCGLLVMILLVVAVAGIGILAMQGRRTPAGTPVYVALGSSYAAGAGLGTLQTGSPIACARSIAGYPQQLAAMLKLPIVDMSCGGAVTGNLLRGGQFFQGPQIRVIDARTRLVTITVGGNDVGLVGDLSMMAMREAGGAPGWLTGRLWSGPKLLGQRDFTKLHRELLELIHAIRVRAPRAAIVVASYPHILPAAGTCPQIRLSDAEADLMRPVERTLADTTRAAAAEGGAIFIDMHALGAGHDACSAAPWIHGWSKLSAAPFHPTLDGAKATAAAIAAALPAGITAIGEHDASGHQTGGIGGKEVHH